MSEKGMDKSHDLRDEYDLSQLKGEVRGKYAQRVRMGTNLVLLDPDVARVFSTPQAVNDALRMLIQIAQAQARDEKQSVAG